LATAFFILCETTGTAAAVAELSISHSSIERVAVCARRATVTFASAQSES
jgi:hypothetical protein